MRRTQTADRRSGLGSRGEALAAEALTRLGWAIVERNWRCRAGEADIVARRDAQWAFFEVRTRRGRGFGTPEESLTQAKQERMAQVALCYLAEHELGDVDWGLGMVAVELDTSGRLLRVEVYESLA